MMCAKCGRELEGKVAPGIEDEIRILLSGSSDASLLDKAWFITAENERRGVAYWFRCMQMRVKPE